MVQVKAAGLNPSDLGNVMGRFKATTLPRTPGRDFAGSVISSGSRYQGQLVWGSVPGFGITRDGSQAEYVLVPEEALSVSPANLTPEQAAGVGVPFTTAWGALMQAARLQNGETVLIVGAGGAVGQAATQIANWKGARVLGGTRGAKQAPGVAAAVDTEGDMPHRVFELTDGKGADVVFDTVGGAMFEPALRSLARDGRQVAITSGKEARVSFNLVDFYHNRSRLIGFDSFGFTSEDTSAILDELRSGFESNLLSPPQLEAIPFDKAVDAYRALSGGNSGLKTVLTFS